MDKYALVIGIPTYQSGNFGKLEKTTADAENVAQILEKYGNFRVERLPKRANAEKTGYEMKADNVTFDQLNQTLQTFLQRAAGKNALIYFTGHGFTVSTKVGREKGFLATSDCLVEVSDDPVLGRKVIDQKNGLDLDDFEWLIRKSELSSLVVLLDCCHSGFFLERRLVEGATLVNTFISKKDYYLITACRSLETAKTVKSHEHSVFSGFLIKGLSEQNADSNGEISGDRLFDFIRREIKGRLQEPIRMGVGDAIVLVKYLLQNTPVDAAVVDANGEAVCPYQGLQPFDEAQRMFFFGRNSLVQQILRKLGEKRFVPVIGASGSGKSSVIRAGLIPQLKQDGSWQVMTPIKPGIEPLSELRKAFEPFFDDEDKIQELYIAIKTSVDGLFPIINSLPGSKNYLLVIDQFEELFTLCRNEADQERFIELITQVSSIPDSRLSVVLTMRADFLEPCLHYPTLIQLIQTQTIYMPPLTGADLEEAITKPAKIQAYNFGDGLLGAILRDVRQEQGILPLLEFALAELWERRDCQNRQLTLEQYQDSNFGGVIGALDRHAEKVYKYKDFLKQSPQQLRPHQEQDLIRQISLKLVRTGEGEKDTRQRQAKTELLDMASDSNTRKTLSKVIDDLVKGRLLVMGESTQKQLVEQKQQEKSIDDLGEVIQESQIIDLAHEALMEGWKRFAEWRKEGRELRRLSDRLKDALHEWQKNPKDDNLMMGGLLAQVREKWQELQHSLSHAARDFFQKSNARDQEKIIALRQALLREQAERVNDLLSNQPVDALIMAIQATGRSLELLGEVFSPIQTIFHKAVKVAREKNCFRGHQSWVNSATFIPNTDLIVSGSDDGTLRLWNLQGGSVREPFKGHEAAIRSIAVSPKGDCIASCSNDKTIRVWNLQGISINEPFKGHEDDVISVAFSPDGQYIISGSKDKTLRLWNLQGKQVGEPFRGHEDRVGTVAFSPDGKHIISGSRDRTIRLWDLQGKQVIEPFKGHEGTIGAVAFSPDGKHIISGSRDRTIRLWDLQGKQVIEPFKGHGGAVICIAFSPNSQYIVSGSEDRTVRIWDIKGDQVGKPFQGHQGSINSAIFSLDNNYILSASEDKTIRLWDFQNFLNTKRFGKGVVSVAFSPDSQCIISAGRNGVQLWNLSGHLINGLFQESEDEDINSIAFSSNGQYVVGGNGNRESWRSSRDIPGTILIWNLNGNLVRKFESHEDYITSVACSPDGQYIVSGSNDATIRLWNLEGKQIQEPFRGHMRADVASRSWGSRSEIASISSLSFSPDGQYIISSGNDGTIRLWDVQGNQIGNPFQGHQDGVKSVAFSPDGQYIVSGGNDGTIRLWDVQGNELTNPFYGHSYSVNSVAFSPDSQHIASAGMDGTVRLWDLQGNQIGESLETNDAYSVTFSPNGQHIVSCSEYGAISLHKFENWEHWLKLACERLQNHPLFKGELTQEAREACEVCQKYSWNSAAEARTLLNEGKLLAHRKDFVAAASSFQKALELDPSLNIEPEVEARRPEALIRAMQGRLLASKLEIEAALVKFQEALKQAPDLALDLKTEVGKFAVPVLIKQGTTLAKEDTNVASAVTKFRQAVELDPNLNLDPEAEAGRLAAATLINQAKKLVEPYYSSDQIDIEGAIVKFKQAVELDPNLNLDPEAEARRLAAATLVNKAKKLVEPYYSSDQIDIEGAIIKFKQAVELDPNLNLNPEAEAGRLAAATLVNQAKNLLNNLDLNEAVVKLQQALELDPTLEIDIEVEVKRFKEQMTVPQLLQMGKKLLQKGKVQEALLTYREVQALESYSTLPTEALYLICWYGSLHGHATNPDIMAACDVAVASDSGSVRSLDARGIARALSGDFQGAIEDFQVYVNRSHHQERKAKRQQWIDALRTGENPFNPEELRKLL